MKYNCAIFHKNKETLQQTLVSLGTSTNPKKIEGGFLSHFWLESKNEFDEIIPRLKESQCKWFLASSSQKASSAEDFVRFVVEQTTGKPEGATEILRCQIGCDGKSPTAPLTRSRCAQLRQTFMNLVQNRVGGINLEDRYWTCGFEGRPLEYPITSVPGGMPEPPADWRLVVAGSGTTELPIKTALEIASDLYDALKSFDADPAVEVKIDTEGSASNV